MKKLLSSFALGVVLTASAVWTKNANFFPDVHVADWFYPYVEEIRGWGVVNGNSDGTFAPERNINRAEFSKMMVLYDQRVDEKIENSQQYLSSQEKKSPPSVMYLEKFNEYPADCPNGWTEADFGVSWRDNSHKSFTRTCYTKNFCQVMYLRHVSEEPNNCPQSWTEADFGIEWNIGINQVVRTCYICQ